jgi:hypothetical protein
MFQAKVFWHLVRLPWIGWPLRSYLRLLTLQEISLRLSKGQLSFCLRNAKKDDMNSWEFSVFSQNGEDGIISELWKRVATQNKFFLEIGSGDGMENNTTFLAVVKYFSGVMVEGREESSWWCQYWIGRINPTVLCKNLFVTKENVKELVESLFCQEPDLLSVDIDGMDYWIVSSLLECGVYPKICVVEYNSAFGPEMSVSVPYDPGFTVKNQPGWELYYGCSLLAWRKLLEKAGYAFVGVESSGVNAFFVRKAAFAKESMDGVKGRLFAVNRSHRSRYGEDWVKHWKILEALGAPLVAV